MNGGRYCRMRGSEAYCEEEVRNEDDMMKADGRHEKEIEKEKERERQIQLPSHEKEGNSK